MIAIVEPVLNQRGLELVDLEMHGAGRGQVLRLLVDREGGVDLDSLSSLSRELSDLLDVEEVVPGAYTLEVSSPGMNRPLTRPAHFARFVGKRVRLRSRDPLDGQRNFLGELAAVSEAGVTLRLESAAEVFIPFTAVDKANYEHDFCAADFGSRNPSARERGPRHGR